MELVYLWVEEYKNIKRQGFNFSPKFRCEFKPEYEKDENGDEFLKDDCELIIEENKDYLSIFPENINITAIVGENGSGKSTILDIVTNMNRNLSKLIIYYNGKELIVKNSYLDNFSINYLRIGVTQLKELNENNLSLRDSLFKNYQKYFFVNKEKKLDSYWYDFINISYLESDKNTQIIINLLKNRKIRLPFNTPKYFTISLKDTDYFDKIIESKIERDESFNISFIENNFFNLDYEIKENKLKRVKFYLIIANIFTYNEDLNNSFASIFFSNNSPQSIDDIIDMFLLYLSPSDKEDINFIVNSLENSFESNKYFNEFTIKIEKLDKNFINRYRRLISSKDNYFSKENNIFDFRFDTNLSDGEFEFLLIFSRIYEKIENKDSIILIDEGEKSLHPNWQKKYIYFLVQFFEKNYQNKIQLLLTTHSSFILSDIPKESIIFLEKDEKTGNCINATEKMEDFNTFGANIHTLLSHGFFMKNGLMGEFAKSKIERIKRFYEIVKKSENEIQNNTSAKKAWIDYFLRRKDKYYYIQSIIGEPFLQKVIKNYLDELEKVFDKENYKQKKLKKLVEEFGEDTVRKFLDND
ncbi:hypothetical protein CRV01_01535 [Arcobacter sp. CECT 8983]|uniref:AAA family ATPase n=1 Tax=Arcobacter sp. CECT 8983 TaxID=2044508 RepID=UPI00100AB698|nr:AAA family ATPase [Arcobacter sp. CECT 8983]RXJ91800.1 hypothetical protein CRV01_01535 [Arcobacter sp. CECT 8983]